MLTINLPQACTAKQPPTVQHVRDLSTRYGLTVVAPHTSDDMLVRRVVWIVEDWAEEPFNQRVVPWSTVVGALASESETSSLRLLGHDYVGSEDRRRAAEWFLRYVLEHLDEGSGLAVVRLRA